MNSNPTMRRFMASVARPKLLVVDDQPLNIRVLHELLRADFDIFMAADGEQALIRCRELQPDLVLLDVMMPGMDGYEVCRQLKADAHLALIPVIFISAHFDEAEEVRGFELGAVDFIHKPINPVITRARVRTQLLLKQQADMLRSIALLDGLTGVANRRKFDDEFSRLWAQCVRDQTPLSLIMLDVDFFKRFNDRYGHGEGDLCLLQVAQTINSLLERPCDLLARYGGEEFVCLLPNTELAGAVHLAELMLERVLALKLPHIDSDAAAVVSISLGVAAVVPNSELIPARLLELADQQLYMAKAAGRAQVQWQPLL